MPGISQRHFQLLRPWSAQRGEEQKAAVRTGLHFRGIKRFLLFRLNISESLGALDDKAETFKGVTPVYGVAWVASIF